MFHFLHGYQRLLLWQKNNMKCIVCGNKSWTYLFAACDRMLGVPGVFAEYRCTACGFVRLDPQPSQKELKKYYPSRTYYSYSGKTKVSFFGWLRSYLIQHLHNPTVFTRLIGIFIHVPAMPTVAQGRVMDVGCGSGDTLTLLKSVGWDVYGLDIDTLAIKIAHKRGLKNVSIGSYEDLKKYPDNSFDAIRLYHVIEHLDDPELCLHLAYKKLKRGGEIILGTPNASSLVARIFRQYWYNLDAPRHLHLFSPKTLTTLAARAKFRHTHIEFASAGGWIGSVQYIITQLLAKNIDLINRQWLVLAVYPWEWMLDRFGWGDVFVLIAKK